MARKKTTTTRKKPSLPKGYDGPAYRTNDGGILYLDHADGEFRIAKIGGAISRDLPVELADGKDWQRAKHALMVYGIRHGLHRLQ